MKLAGAEEKRQEAERLVAAAKRVEWRITRLGQWVLAAGDDGPFGRQPGPAGDVDPPPSISPHTVRAALTRSWHRPRVGSMSLSEEDVRLVDDYLRHYFGLEPPDGLAPAATIVPESGSDEDEAFAAYMAQHFARGADDR